MDWKLQTDMVKELLLAWPQKQYNIQSQIKDSMINTFSPNKLKLILLDFFLKYMH